MSILIKGMEKPEYCLVCPYAFCHLDTRNCPIVEVPTPHGKLKDGDSLIELCGILADKTDSPQIWEQLISMIESVPTIIEAEEEYNE